MVHNDVSLMVSFLESVHLNAGYHREQSLAPFYFTFKTLHRMYAELSIDNVPIVKFTSVKSLGIYIDENLRWQTHFDKLS